MITKRTGNGQTECFRCKQKGKWSLTWDSFLYTFNNKPYCFDCLMEVLELNSKKLDNIKFYIEQNNIKDMLWGKEILKIIGENND